MLNKRLIARLLAPTADTLRLIGEVTSPAVFDVSGHINDEGLYSQTIFGVVGSPERNRKRGFIKLNVPVIHPLIYEELTRLSAFYKGILTGKRYATWDPKAKDFIPSDSFDGKTGYTFFYSKLSELTIVRNMSKKRDERIDLFYKYRKAGRITFKYMYVLPAGLRDFNEDSNNVLIEDEINDLYRALLRSANLFRVSNLSSDELYLMDTSRQTLQRAVGDIYDYLINLNDGKNKFRNGKWAKRAIENGTANVATSIPTKVTSLNDTNNLSMNRTVLGLFQYSKGTSPITTFEVTNKFLTHIFENESRNVKVVDSKTMKTTVKPFSQKLIDKWMTQDGLDNILGKLLDDNIKNTPIRIGNDYMMLVYDTGLGIKRILDTSDLPDDIDKKKLRPITYGELFYLSVYENITKYPGILTRYPVVGQGSSYPSTPYIKTTTKSRNIKYFDDIKSDTFILINEYPVVNGTWVNSISPHYSKIARLGLDYDGDKVHYNILYEEESIDEISKLLKNASFYITPSGEMASSLSDDVVNNVLATLTKTI